MNEKTMIGYHATQRKNIPLIIENGFKESKVNKGHWLGRGIYLFDNLYFAIEWEILGVQRHKIKKYKEIEKKCGILVVDIDVEKYNIIDFSEPQGFAIFEKLQNLIKKNYPERKAEEIIERGYAYIINVLENLEKQNKDKYISNFDVICAVYPKYMDKRKKHTTGDFITCVQKQICIKNAKVIKNIKELEHSEMTKGYFDLIIKNRGDISD